MSSTAQGLDKCFFILYICRRKPDNNELKPKRMKYNIITIYIDNPYKH